MATGMPRIVENWLVKTVSQPTDSIYTINVGVEFTPRAFVSSDRIGSGLGSQLLNAVRTYFERN